MELIPVIITISFLINILLFIVAEVVRLENESLSYYTRGSLKDER